MFVTKLDTNLAGVASLAYSTLLGGSSVDVGEDIRIELSRDGQHFVFTVMCRSVCPRAEGAGVLALIRCARAYVLPWGVVCSLLLPIGVTHAASKDRHRRS